MYIKKYSNILYVLIIVIRLVHSKQISLYDTKKKNRFFFSIRDCLVVILKVVVIFQWWRDVAF